MIEPTLFLLFIVVYVIIVDRNVADYLYLKLFAEPIQNVILYFWRIRLLAVLKYERFLMSRGHVAKKYYKMAEEVRKEVANPK